VADSKIDMNVSIMQFIYNVWLSHMMYMPEVI
jgi:hypothetical protein